ncbi:putative membrane protein DUF2157 [Roseimicrobium gellanilyticum]|uniref:Putative membrane protein DUF2157 n=1 Tax=Roseimicrobium gellanilyticum TaxID=748857 RepID=A0A366H2E0_9BACT|nr:DUF2157 domain-containing protein [Roseimicrobium gellanilyticum]RBP36071.1 putative membrane protein DUF2157 [Roseimicrobium gellanilyticum]
MANARDEILEWAQQGHIPPEHMRSALEKSGALPDESQWRTFFDKVLLSMGAVLLGAGVIFFFAYNWQDLGRFAKFALVQAPILAGLAVVWKLGIDGAPGKAALITITLLVGALLALVGQTYQTGADTFELFAVWALAILPWTLAARFPALWLIWLALVNVAIGLYFNTTGRMLGMAFRPDKLMWVLFGFNTIALAVWEGLAAAGVTWLRERWAMRVMAVASGYLATSLAMHDILDSPRGFPGGLIAWFAWMVVSFCVYRYVVKDLFVLAGGLLSLILVVVTAILKETRFDSAAVFLVIGLIVIGISAAGGWWLKQVASEEESA